VQEVHRAIQHGEVHVVDADLSKYFDTIPHRELMQSVARRVSDGKMLRLIKMWLKAAAEETDDRGHTLRTGGERSREGTPQGGVISPLLANVYIHRLLKTWKKFGLERHLRARIINYADDLVILCRDRFGAETALKSLRAVLRPGNQSRAEEGVAEVNRRLVGWANYFCMGTLSGAYRALDHYTCMLLRSFLVRRHKVPGRGTRRFSNQRLRTELGLEQLSGRRRVALPHALK